ncbi:MAG: glycosyltransferase family 4 protein [Haloarculaceae archaeon]
MRILSLVTSAHARFYRQQLARLRARGHTVETVAVPGRSVEDGIQFEGRTPLTYARYYPRAVAASLRDYDVVHANYGLTGPPAVVQPFHPVVLTLWGSDVMGEYAWLSRLCSRLADATVVMSEPMADAVGRDCHVIPHGVDFETFRPLPRDTAREKVGWDPDAYHVLFPYGPSRQVKNYPRAEHIVELARPELDDRVELQTMTGLAHEEVPWYMNAADAMVLTSKREGSPNTVKEALACNCPVISVDVGDVKDRLDGATLSTAESDDELLADALVNALRSDEDANGREVVSEIRLEHQVDRIEALLRSVSRGEVVGS